MVVCIQSEKGSLGDIDLNPYPGIIEEGLLTVCSHLLQKSDRSSASLSSISK